MSLPLPSVPTPSRPHIPRSSPFRPRASHALAALAAAAAAALTLAACSPQTGAAGSAAGEADADGATASATEGPGRIVAVSSDVADMALLLAGPERMAAVSESSRSPHMGMVPELAEQVADTLPAGIEPDAEQILSYSPDLVLTTARHAGERSAGDQLEGSGVDSLTFSSDDFTSPEAYADALVRLGEALGEQEAAGRHADDLLEGIHAVDDAVSGDGEASANDVAEAGETAANGDGPRVLALMARGGTVMAMDGGLMLPGLAIRAGAIDAAAEAGITSTSPLDAELLVKADPDIILIEDFMGAGEKPFGQLLGSEAVVQVPAVAHEEVHVVPMTEASAVAGIHLPDGYRAVAGIVSGASASD